MGGLLNYIRIGRFISRFLKDTRFLVDWGLIYTIMTQDLSKWDIATTKRTRLLRPYPKFTLENALSIANMIHHANSGLPFDRILLAKSLGTTHSSSTFVMKLNSSASYGLTVGAYNDDLISLTGLGEAIVAPQRSEEKRSSLIDAAIHPELFRRFFNLYDGKQLPKDEFSQNMLQRELGVHPELGLECLQILKDNGYYVGILSNINGEIHVSLSANQTIEDQSDSSQLQSNVHRHDLVHGGRIFIGHAGASDVVDFIKTVLGEFDIPYSVVQSDFEDQRPISSDVSREMHNCDAAILVIAKPALTRVSGGREVSSSTQSMLYQLGAASLIYGDRIIAITDQGAKPDQPESDFHYMHFDRDRLGEIGLVLLGELYRIGVIEVRVPNRTDGVSKGN